VLEEIVEVLSEVAEVEGTTIVEDLIVKVIEEVADPEVSDTIDEIEKAVGDFEEKFDLDDHHEKEGENLFPIEYIEDLEWKKVFLFKDHQLRVKQKLSFLQLNMMKCKYFLSLLNAKKLIFQKTYIRDKLNLDVKSESKPAPLDASVSEAVAQENLRLETIFFPIIFENIPFCQGLKTKK